MTVGRAHSHDAAAIDLPGMGRPLLSVRYDLALRDRPAMARSSDLNHL